MYIQPTVNVDTEAVEVYKDKEAISSSDQTVPR